MLESLLSFPRMKELAYSIDTLRRAGRFSSHLMLSEDGLSACPRWSVAEWTPERIKYSRMRLKNLPQGVTEDEILRWLKSYKVIGHRLCLYRNADGCLNGSANVVMESIEEAQRVHNRFKDHKPLWNGVEVLLELEHSHPKSSPSTAVASSPSIDIHPSPDDFGPKELQFLQDCKLRYLTDLWPSIEFILRSSTPQGPYSYVARLPPHSKLPASLGVLEFQGPQRTQKKTSLRLAEFKAACYLLPIVCPNLKTQYPFLESNESETEQEKAEEAHLTRLHRQTELKRLQTIFRELNPQSAGLYLDKDGPLVSVVGSARDWSKKEAKEFAKVIKTLPTDLQKNVASLVNQRHNELNNRGFNDLMRPIILADEKRPSGVDEEEEIDANNLTETDAFADGEDALTDLDKLESLEMTLPATKLEVGVLESPHSMRVLWSTSTQLSVAFEEVTPRLNLNWSRHNIKYQMRNVIKNVSSVMWIETDLGMQEIPTAPSLSTTSALDSSAPSDAENGLHPTTSSQSDSSIASAPSKRATLVSVPATYMDLFIPVDSAPRLCQQEHFQTRKVGAVDFTSNSAMSQMTIMRVHFDLTSLNDDQRTDIIVMCKSLIGIGLLRSRCQIPSNALLQSSSVSHMASGTAPSTSLDRYRTFVSTEKERAYEAPSRLVEVDHWVRWKLACLVTQNKILQHQVTSSAVNLLLTYERTVGFRILEKLEARNERLFNFEERLRLGLSGFTPSVHLRGEHFSLKENHALVAHIVVTPLEVRCEGPLPELSNRLLRAYEPLKERFIRLSFRATYAGGLAGASMRNVGKMAVRKRIGGALATGLEIPALKQLFEIPDAIFRSSLSQPILHSDVSTKADNYERLSKDYSNFSRWQFLVASSSQLRTQKAWMFSSPSSAPRGFALPIHIPEIRNWLGEFDHICNVAMYAARLGQGLSSTYKCFDVDPSWIRSVAEVRTDDGAYMFSDGCAAISPSIAKRAATALGLSYVPSAFQIRLAGIKGMVSIDTRLDGDVICVRPSMKKFEAPKHAAFEVVSWSRPLHAHLNKQIIQILSALGLSDERLIEVQKRAFDDIASATFPRSFDSDEDRERRIESLAQRWKSSSKPGSLEHRAVAMLRAGFDPHKELHLKSILTSLGLRQLQDIHSMARIPIKNGRYAIGIMDELGVLEPGQVYFKMSTTHASLDASEPAHFVHTDLLCVSRSPCLHPGDARFVQAVDMPELAHLVDVIVFPQKGVRPIPDECSGGDLDGDQYLILWGDDFMPPKRDTPAFKHETSGDAAKASKDDNEVCPHELVDFFMNYIFDDKLSSIADAHTYWADQSDLGVFDERCLRLAEAHDVAVDAPKTGKVVPPMDELCVSAWPDFMNVNKCGVYRSKKVLGKLFQRSSEQFSTLANHSSVSQALISDSSFDEDMKYPGYEAFIDFALAARDEYCEHLNTTMQLFHLRDEASVVSGEPLYRFRSERREWESKKEGFEAANSNLRARFRALFEVDAKVDSDETALDTSQNRLKLASAWYVVTYDPKFWCQERTPMFSFPWVVEDQIIEIKLGAAQRSMKSDEMGSNAMNTEDGTETKIEQLHGAPASPPPLESSLPSDSLLIIPTTCNTALGPATLQVITVTSSE